MFGRKPQIKRRSQIRREQEAAVQKKPAVPSAPATIPKRPTSIPRAPRFDLLHRPIRISVSPVRAWPPLLASLCPSQPSQPDRWLAHKLGQPRESPPRSNYQSVQQHSRNFNRTTQPGHEQEFGGGQEIRPAESRAQSAGLQPRPGHSGLQSGKGKEDPAADAESSSRVGKKSPWTIHLFRLGSHSSRSSTQKACRCPNVLYPNRPSSCSRSRQQFSSSGHGLRIGCPNGNIHREQPYSVFRTQPSAVQQPPLPRDPRPPPNSRWCTVRPSRYCPFSCLFSL